MKSDTCPAPPQCTTALMVCTDPRIATASNTHACPGASQSPPARGRPAHSVTTSSQIEIVIVLVQVFVTTIWESAILLFGILHKAKASAPYISASPVQFTLSHIGVISLVMGRWVIS